MNRTVLIFRSQLLRPSETFIEGQAAFLTRYRPSFVGRRQFPGGLALPEERTVLMNCGGLGGRVREIRFLLTGSAPGFVRRLRALEPDLIHAHFGMDGALALPLAAELGIPLVVTFHGYDATALDACLPRWSLPPRIYLRRRERLKREASRFIAVSEFIRGELLSRGFPEDRVVRHHIGIDLDRFPPAGDALPERTILFVGRLVPKKGCEHLIDAVARVQVDHPDVRLVIVGDGPLRAQLEQRATRLSDTCQFVGWQTPAEVRRRLQRTRVFCVPSVRAPDGDAEGLGMVFLEAQATGVPVASFASGGIPEAVAHGETGLLGPVGDTGELARNLARLLTDDALWTRFRRAGIKRVSEQFDIRRQCRSLETIYDEVIAP